jgi:hypothetical protein
LGIVSGSSGVRCALFVEDFDFDDCTSAAGLTNANFFGVHRLRIFQIQPFNTGVRRFQSPSVAIVTVVLDVRSSGGLIRGPLGLSLGVVVGRRGRGLDRRLTFRIILDLVCLNAHAAAASFAVVSASSAEAPGAVAAGARAGWADLAVLVAVGSGVAGSFFAAGRRANGRRQQMSVIFIGCSWN